MYNGQARISDFLLSFSPVPQVPGQAQRKSAVKTPKVDKIKVERKKKKLEKGEVVEKKEKGPPRKRKKTESVAVSLEADRSAEGLLSGQSGPVTTINEPCLTSGETPPAIKPKKVRVKNLEPMPPKIAKIDVDTKPNDGNNDNDGDDSSTAGNEHANYFDSGNYRNYCIYFFIVSLDVN